jgi:hypothetical protein
VRTHHPSPIINLCLKLSFNFAAELISQLAVQARRVDVRPVQSMGHSTPATSHKASQSQPQHRFSCSDIQYRSPLRGMPDQSSGAAGTNASSPAAAAGDQQQHPTLLELYSQLIGNEAKTAAAAGNGLSAHPGSFLPVAHSGYKLLHTASSCASSFRDAAAQAQAHQQLQQHKQQYQGLLQTAPRPRSPQTPQSCAAAAAAPAAAEDMSLLPQQQHLTRHGAAHTTSTSQAASLSSLNNLADAAAAATTADAAAAASARYTPSMCPTKPKMQQQQQQQLSSRDEPCSSLLALAEVAIAFQGQEEATSGTALMHQGMAATSSTSAQPLNASMAGHEGSSYKEKLPFDAVTAAAAPWAVGDNCSCQQHPSPAAAAAAAGLPVAGRSKSYYQAWLAAIMHQTAQQQQQQQKAIMQQSAEQQQQQQVASAFVSEACQTDVYARASATAAAAPAAAACSCPPACAGRQAVLHQRLHFEIQQSPLLAMLLGRLVRRTNAKQKAAAAQPAAAAAAQSPPDTCHQQRQVTHGSDNRAQQKAAAAGTASEEDYAVLLPGVLTHQSSLVSTNSSSSTAAAVTPAGRADKLRAVKVAQQSIVELPAGTLLIGPAEATQWRVVQLTAIPQQQQQQQQQLVCQSSASHQSLAGAMVKPAAEAGGTGSQWRVVHPATAANTEQQQQQASSISSVNGTSTLGKRSYDQVTHPMGDPSPQGQQQQHCGSSLQAPNCSVTARAAAAVMQQLTTQAAASNNSTYFNDALQGSTLMLPPPKRQCSGHLPAAAAAAAAVGAVQHQQSTCTAGAWAPANAVQQQQQQQRLQWERTVAQQQLLAVAVPKASATARF